MATMVYNYTRDTHEFTYAKEARMSPLEPTVPLVPAYSSLKQPPAAGANQVAVCDPALDTWSLVEDYRGTPVYSTADGGESVVDYLGLIKPGYTQQAPSAPTDMWDGSNWQAKPGEFYNWDDVNKVWVAMTSTEIDTYLQSQYDLEFNFSSLNARDKTILLQIFKLAQFHYPNLTKSQFLNQVYQDYKTFRGG